MSDEEAIVEVEVVSAEVVDSSTSLNAANVLESEPAVIEDVPFEEIDIKRGLFELDSALKEGGDKKEIRSIYTKLTRTFPTAVHTTINCVTMQTIFLITLLSIIY